MFILQIRAGSDVAGNGGSLYKARKIIAHEKYVDESKIDEFDIALIKLTEPIQFTDRIKLVNIATEEPSEGERGWVTGYGKQEAARRV